MPNTKDNPASGGASGSASAYTPAVRDALMRAQVIARNAGSEYVDINHLKMAVREEHIGYVCACCKTPRPANWYLYRASNPDTGKAYDPLCGKCAQNHAAGGLPWKYEGPFPAPSRNNPVCNQAGEKDPE